MERSCTTCIPLGDDDTAAAKLVHDMAIAGGPLPASAPCCPACGGIELDPLEPPTHPNGLLAAGRGCPLSAVAYVAAAKARDGHAVRVVAGPNLPTLIVDGKTIDPLEGYRGKCRGGSC